MPNASKRLTRLKKIAIRLFVGVTALILLIALIVAIFPERTLGWLVQQWEIGHPAEEADAIVIFGGGSHFRPHQAAKLWEADLAPIILTFESPPPDGDEKEIEHHLRNTDQFILKELGVPSSITHIFDAEVSSTWDEAWAIRNWVVEHDAETLLISTDRFHSRRVHWLMQKIVEEETGCRCLISISPWHYHQTDNWWKNRWGRMAFLREVVRLAFYKAYYSWRI